MNWTKSGLLIACAAPWAIGAVGSREASPTGDVTYRSVAPIFKTSCVSCHGSDVKMGGLDLSTPEGIKKGGDSGSLYIKGNAKKSLLVQRIKGLGGKPQMPMGFKPLDKRAIAVIEDWIGLSARFEKQTSVKRKHWSYIAPVKPPVPLNVRARWGRGEIDAFVFDRLTLEGMSPSPQAEKATLVRRVFLDLIGLPPTIAQVEEFLADTKPGAYERLVDRLLISPHYGERQAIGWLDLARYADSNGYEADRRRSMWPYRDWVITAFNKNMPYDQFTIEQISGDMLPDPTKDQLIATGFHRNTMINEEGGVDKNEQRWLTLVDRVGTTATVWLGSSLACAQCHDHKYDPFSMEEFYKFLAFFDNSEEPTINVQDSVTLDRIKRLGEQIAQLERVLPELKQDSEPYKLAVTALENIRGEANALNSMTTLVMKENDKYPPTTRIRTRGTFTNPAKQVTPGTLAVLPAMPSGAKRNRIGLAQWLVSKNNPLTARVMVNRIWEQYFGTGLVKTSGDFGTMGEAPSHHELLDWLAVEFMESGWDIKHIHRLIVTSSTYRQSSHARPELLAKDPTNRLLSRSPRLRLPAELIRDNALAASGLLSKKIGGPSVFPDQPEGVWKLPYNDDRWVASDGDDLYRRGVYTFWRRSAAYPSFLNFDAMSREGCIVKRESTNTPLQALTTLNDEAFFRAARALAKKMIEEEKETNQRIELGFRRVLVRRPNQIERERLADYYLKELKRFNSLEVEAKKMLKQEKPFIAGATIAECAAMTMVANVILNLDEAITKE